MSALAPNPQSAIRDPQSTQAELDFAAGVEGRKGRARERLPALVGALRGRGWETRRTLEGEGFGERELREIGEVDEEGQLFSHPGSPGYKLMEEATMAEFRHGTAALRSQIRLMARKLMRMLRAWHRLGRER